MSLVEWVTTYHSGPHELISWVRDFQSIIFVVLLCGLLFVFVLIRTNINYIVSHRFMVLDDPVMF